MFLCYNKFEERLDDAGSSGGKSVRLKFPYMMLSTIFTRDGERWPFGNSRFDPLFQDYGAKDLQSDKSDTKRFQNEVRRLFTKIQEESTLLNTSWNCRVGHLNTSHAIAFRRCCCRNPKQLDICYPWL